MAELKETESEYKVTATEMELKYEKNEKMLLMKNDEIEFLKRSLELAQNEKEKLENLIAETKLNGLDKTSEQLQLIGL